MKNTSVLFLIFGIIGFFSCKNEVSKNVENKVETPAKVTEKISPIIPLFDGKSTDGWRVFNGTDFPENWIVEDGALKCLGTAGQVENGGDLVYEKAFENFELTLEWKVSARGNSGIFYHIVEGKEYYAAYQTGPEYQVLDDTAFPEEPPVHLSGADYAMYPALDKTTKPAGSWNTSKIIFTEAQVQHWINGSKVVEYVPWSDDWNAKKEASKWKTETNYGMAKTGLIGLQDHGQVVWYRNIKIKEL